jgi:hypothetical protein
MGPRFAQAIDMRGRKAKAVQLVAACLLAAVVGVLGGRITSAALLYRAYGWHTMWIEVATWGPVAQEPRQQSPSSS